jgi:signal peptidase II
MSDIQTAPAAKPSAVTRLGLAAYGLALVVAILDQASKAYVLGPLGLPDIGQITVLPIFRLTMVWNPGVSFGLLAAKGDLGRWLLTAFAAAVVAGLAIWVRRANRWLTSVSVGLIMGGAIGNNIVDRVRFGAVADFLDFSGIGFKWVFNVADSAITVGVALLLLEMVLTAKSPTDGARS